MKFINICLIFIATIILLSFLLLLFINKSSDNFIHEKTKNIHNSINKNFDAYYINLKRRPDKNEKTLKEINDCEVEITFDPTWTQDMMSEEAKLELGML